MTKERYTKLMEETLKQMNEMVESAKTYEEKVNAVIAANITMSNIAKLYNR